MDFKKRLRNKPFLVSLFSATLLLLQAVLAPFDINFELISQQVTQVFNACLTVLTILGIVVDPSSQGWYDLTHPKGEGIENNDNENE